MVLNGRVGAHQQGIEHERQQGVGTEQGSDEQHRRSQREQGGQEMDQLQRFGVLLVEVDAGDARIVYLLEELLQVRAPLVVHPRIGEEAAAVSALEDADTEVDVLAEAHLRKSAQGQVDFAADAHVEAAGVELVHLLLAAADAAGGEERGHGVVDGLLDVAERWVCPVGASEGVGGCRLEFLFDGSQIVRGQDAVGVQYDEVFPPAAFGAVVARLSGAGVGLGVVVQVQPVAVSFGYVAAGDRRPVFHHQHFKIAERLGREALQQFVHLVGAVVHGDDE